ncbi:MULTISPECIES: hypothetical protein [Cellulosimicrobium]|uniref:hypothetical protein n=1 Tax=Cellulosimicrobium TaxID=157920 RepID=UPI001BA6E21C|nr:hypothetical protein [Cellulosimicrobium cellulans]QUC01891.1 hypothetical protein J5A69_19810 [Cellulosimicrobium cellulans]
MDTLPIPEVLDDPALFITYGPEPLNGQWGSLAAEYARHREYTGVAPRYFAFDDLWLEFSEADGSSAPLPTGWARALLLASGGGNYQRMLLEKLVKVWTPATPPPGGRFGALLTALLFDDVHPDDAQGLPALAPTALAEERTRRLQARRQLRADVAEAAGALVERQAAERRRQREVDAAASAVVREQMRALGLYVRRVRHPSETPASVHRFDCGAVTGVTKKRTIDPALYEGFDAVPEGARMCRTCHPRQTQPV